MVIFGVVLLAALLAADELRREVGEGAAGRVTETERGACEQRTWSYSALADRDKSVWLSGLKDDVVDKHQFLKLSLH